MISAEEFEKYVEYLEDEMVRQRVYVYLGLTFKAIPNYD